MALDPYSIGFSMAAPLIAGGLQSAFGKKYNGPTIDRNALMQRQSEISAFSNRLAQSRQAYKSALTNFGNYNISRFMPQAEAQFAGQGKQVSGGAYASALARETAQAQAQGDLALADMTRADVNALENAQSNLFGQTWGSINQDMANQQARKQAQEANLWGSVGSALGAGANMYGQQRQLASAEKAQESMFSRWLDKQGGVQNAVMGAPASAPVKVSMYVPQYGRGLRSSTEPRPFSF